MCIGIDYCSRKNCLEQEKCLSPGAKAPKKVKINQCQLSKKFCTNDRACEILGQCILDHPLVKKDKDVKKLFRQKQSMKTILKIVTRLMPSLNKPSKKQKKCQQK